MQMHLHLQLHLPLTSGELPQQPLQNGPAECMQRQPDQLQQKLQDHARSLDQPTEQSRTAQGPRELQRTAKPAAEARADSPEQKGARSGSSAQSMQLV